MLKHLPNEVEELIYDFLISPQDVVKLSCLSKYMKTKVDNVAFVKEKRKLHNRCRMFIEDNSLYYHECEEISGEWEKYYKWNWPKNRAEKEYDNTPLWKVGMFVDVLDKINVWGSGIIIDKITDYLPTINQTIVKYSVRFLGWSDSFNEDVTPDKIARFGTKCMNPRCKFDSLKGDHKRWVLFNDLGTWKLDSLYIDLGRSTDEKIFAEIYGREIEITRKNIDSYIRSVTNATVFLSNAERRFRPKTRRLYF
tara:strand:+ start:197 stop:952 length:756 start_codon:yes stop_codon:yes gene_type:complete